MTKFHIGEKVMFKPEHRGYRFDWEPVGYKVFKVTDGEPSAHQRDVDFVTLDDNYGVFSFRLEPVNEVPVFKEEPVAPEPSKKVYIVLDEDEWGHLDIHEAQEEANDMIKLGFRPIVVQIIAKTTSYLEPVT